MRRRCAPLLVALLGIAPAAHASAPALESAVVDARLEDAGRIVVTARYFLQPAGAREISFIAVPFDGARAINVRGFVGAQEISFRSDISAAGRLDGTVSLPEGLERVTLRLDWEVLREPEARSAWLAIPLLVARWPPREALPETFAASVTLPASSVLESAFPTSFRPAASIEPASDARVYRCTLPVMPAVLRLRVTDRAGAAGITIDQAIDLFTAVVLLALGVFGWRRLRETLA